MAEDIINRLASSLGRRDEEPNIALAETIAAASDAAAVQLLVDQLGGKQKDIAGDCIKVLYEIGERRPELIAAHLDVFVQLLTHRNNRLQWGAMTAIHCISKVHPAKVYAQLDPILSSAEKGSVITRDQAVNILIQLAGHGAYHSDAISLLNEQLLSCPTNQLPMYAERMLPAIEAADKALVLESLHSRLDDIDKDSKRKRVEKVIRRLS